MRLLQQVVDDVGVQFDTSIVLTDFTEAGPEEIFNSSAGSAPETPPATA